MGNRNFYQEEDDQWGQEDRKERKNRTRGRRQDRRKRQETIEEAFSVKGFPWDQD